ncbi:MAG: SIR2 family NAD-dependent protein deacylase, partial [Candidatus Dormibacteraceae bacterium]
MQLVHPLVIEMAELAARHRLVPFLGAGCSAPHLGVAWPEIVDELAQDLGTTSRESLAVAEEYVAHHGKEGLCRFLQPRLTVNTYDAAKGETHLQILSLGTGVIYTTNQDNLMEKCLEQYGRKYKAVVQLEDLAEALPGERLYVKFHGDFSSPASVVFAQSDYDARIGSRHFLNVRLQSDLLAKHFLFVGFSFQDPNLRSTFTELRAAFGDRLPLSYLIAWQGNPEIEQLCRDLGIKLLVPLDAHPESSTPAEALTRVLTDLLRETARRKWASELNDLFRPGAPPTRTVATKYDLDAVEASLTKGVVLDSIAVFRDRFDLAIVPKEVQDRVAGLLSDLAKACTNEAEGDALRFALSQLYLTEVGPMIDVVAAAYATANLKPRRGLMDVFSVHMHDWPPALSLLAVARAFDMLAEWNRQLTDGLRERVSSIIEFNGSDLTMFPTDTQVYIRALIDRAWNDRKWAPPTTAEHPLERFARLKKLPHQLPH